MSGFIAAINAIYNFMQIHWDIGGYQISFWELFSYTTLAGIVAFVIRQMLDVEDQEEYMLDCMIIAELVVLLILELIWFWDLMK